MAYHSCLVRQRVCLPAVNVLSGIWILSFFVCACDHISGSVFFYRTPAQYPRCGQAREAVAPICLAPQRRIKPSSGKYTDSCFLCVFLKTRAGHSL